LSNSFKNILITGASTGIGYSAAQAFTAAGYETYGTVRKPADGKRVSKALGKNFHPLQLDVTSEAAVKRGVASLAKSLKGAGLDGLINNAGVALPGPLAEQPMAEIHKMFEVNVAGPLNLIRACLPLLGARESHPGRPGKILNVSSGAGKLTIPFLGAYVASKHALEGLSGSLRKELMPWGIQVVVVGPGNVRTPIWNKMPDLTAYDRTAYGPVYQNFVKFMLAGEKKGMMPEEIAALLVEIMATENPKVRYAPVAQKFANWTLPNLLPEKALDWMMFKALGMKKLG